MLSPMSAAWLKATLPTDRQLKSGENKALTSWPVGSRKYVGRLCPYAYL